MILSLLSHGAESETLSELTNGLCHRDKDSIKEEYMTLINRLNVRLLILSSSHR